MPVLLALFLVFAVVSQAESMEGSQPTAATVVNGDVLYWEGEELLVKEISGREVRLRVTAETKIEGAAGRLKTGDKIAIIKTTSIDCIESAGNYVAVQSGKESYILRDTLNALEARLNPEKFLRISRSAIVNLDRVQELQPMFHGEHVMVLHNGKRLAMTRSLREVEEALKFS